MNDELPPVRCDDPSTWRHKDKKIDLPRLLQLIEENGGPKGLDLHGCDLTGVDLSYSALTPYLQQWPGAQRPTWVYGIWGIDLQGAHLEHAKLTTANLEGANLSSASLERTSFLFTRLDSASFVKANAENATIFRASAREASFQNANLVDANLVASDFREALFGGSNLQRAHLMNAHFEGVDLRQADLRGAMLHGVRLSKTKMSRDNLGWTVGEELVAMGRQQWNHKVGYFDAADVYRDLKANFSELYYHDPASWAYVKEKQMEKMGHFRFWRPRRLGNSVNPLHWIRISGHRRRRLRRWLRTWVSSRRTSSNLSRWLRSWAFELLTGYGERPLLPLLWAGALAAVVFPLLLGHRSPARA